MFSISQYIFSLSSKHYLLSTVYTDIKLLKNKVTRVDIKENETDLKNKKKANDQNVIDMNLLFSLIVTFLASFQKIYKLCF